MTARSDTASDATACPLITLDAVAKTYSAADGHAVRAVDDVTESIAAGEFISILGPSGCGKSTLLKMMAGLLRVSEGRIHFKGEQIDAPHDDFGMVFQSAVLFPWRTILANVALPGEIKGVKRSLRRDKAREMIELVGLAGFENKYPHELSGGMQQRVAIARALVLNPQLLLMDEPFGALDAMSREQMNLELQRISLESGATVIFVTHSIPEAAFLSDRVFVMSGRPSTVLGAVPIDLSRPRSLDMVTSDEFGVYVSRLRELLDVGGSPL